MPLSSAEIAGQAGMYQQMYSANIGYSNMIGGMASMQGPSQAQSDMMMGGIMNRVGGVAAPIAGLGLGMMGLDPMSLGIRAGMGALSGGAGIMGAGIAGLGVGALAAAPMAMMQYAGGQMMTGAHQQQMFNQQMRGAFSFQSPSGSGFNNGQLGLMGNSLRDMAGQMGPGGEMTSFRELSQLAANMGRMGMGTGVRDVQQFRQRFQEMVSNLKIIAKEMNTTMEQAQEFMASMKGSGIFKGGDQLRMASQMRGYSVAGGLATSELSSMANIGAQISRSIGGRGSAGAFGGMRTLGDIGTAIQSGTISEEDIYNATGLTGAEGRQALATRQFSQAASFLQGGRGRRFLASVAGANGHLDEGSVADWMAGGMGTGRTMTNAYKNLGKVGRANFIRNEGKLRGAALERFGGLIPAMSLMQWAGDRGVDIDNMGDREMLFASRQLGMGMDELEVAVKQARDMPNIIRQQQESRRSDVYLQRQAERRRTSGFEGVKRNFEQVREKINGELQRAGADIMESGSNMIERFFNQMTGTYYDHVTNEAKSAFQAAAGGMGSGALRGSILSGGVTNKAFLGARPSGTAMGGDFMGGVLATAAGASVGGQVMKSMTSIGAGGAYGAFMGSNQSTLGRMLGGKTDYEAYTAAGFGGRFAGLGGITDPAARDKALAQRLQEINQFHAAMNQVPSNEILKLGADFKDELKSAYVNQGFAGMAGDDRVNAVRKWLESKASGDPQAAKALAALKKAPKGQEGAILQGLEMGAGVAQGALLSEVSLPPELRSQSGGFLTATDMYDATGEKMSGRTTSLTGTLSRAFAAAASPTNSKPGNWFTAAMEASSPLLRAGREVFESMQQRKENIRLGEFIKSGDGQQMLRKMVGGSLADVASVKDQLADKLSEMQAKNQTGSGEYAMYKRLYATADAAELAKRENRSLTEADISSLAKTHGISADDLKMGLYMGVQEVETQRLSNIRGIAREQGEVGRGLRRDLLQSGSARIDGGELKLTAAAAEKFRQAGGAKGEEFVAQYLASIGSQASMTGARGTEGMDENLLRSFADQRKMSLEDLRSLSVAQQRAIAQSARAQGLDQVAEAAEFQAAFTDKYQKLQRRGRGSDAYAVSKMLGADISMRDVFGKQGTQAGGRQLAAQTLQQLGVQGSTGLMNELSALYSGVEVSTDANGVQQSRKLSSSERQRRLQQLTTGEGELGSEFREAKKKAGEQQDREKNPLMSKVADTLASIKDSIEAQKTPLNLIATNTGLTVTKLDEGPKTKVGGKDNK